MVEDEAITRRFELLAPHLDERTRRLLAASEAVAIGRGGASVVARATGVSRRVIGEGIKELNEALPRSSGQAGAVRVRRPGGGRKRTSETDPTLREDLERLVEPVTRGDPESPLRWTCKSVRKLAEELGRMGHQVSHRLVAELLHDLDYSLQANRKVLEGSQHPDRNAQFEHLNQQVQAQITVRSRPSRSMPRRRSWSARSRTGARAAAEGPAEPRWCTTAWTRSWGGRRRMAYDVAQNQGWVTVGIDHDTAEFAVASIRQWWQTLGQATYPERPAC